MNLIAAFSSLQRQGVLELISSSATHAFLPAYQLYPQLISAQIKTALKMHHDYFEQPSLGFWLPECGYYEGLDRILSTNGIQYFILNSHGVLFADPRPLFGVYAPIQTPVGVIAFGRDLYSSRQVWSAKEGYPGDPVYREFYRDIGYDLDIDYLRPYLQSDGQRKNLGIKYHRITGQIEDKQIYRLAEALARAELHAAHFAEQLKSQISVVYSALGNQPPIFICPYDAELFGHWWFEGPHFLITLIRILSKESEKLELTTPSDYLARYPFHQVCSPIMSSWGSRGYSEVWLNPSNDWIYRHIHWAIEQMLYLRDRFPKARGWLRRSLNQAARELMLAQASDWAFIMKTKTAVEYAVNRTKEHLSNFRKIKEQIENGKLDHGWIQQIEGRNNLFPQMDYYRDFSRQGR